jgi:hemolysin III
VWIHYGFGTPHHDGDGMPTYLEWEKVGDALVHAVALVWTVVSDALLLRKNSSERIVVYASTMLVLFSASTAYNVVGCGWRLWTEQLRRLDQACIFVAFGGVYTVFVRNAWALFALWTFCGFGAVMKLMFGASTETFTLFSFLVLGAAPVVLAVPQLGFVGAYAYPFVVASVATLAVGVVCGYMNNARGAMVFWHCCVLAASVTVWVLVYNTVDV